MFCYNFVIPLGSVMGLGLFSANGFLLDNGRDGGGGVTWRAKLQHQSFKEKKYFPPSAPVGRMRSH